MTWRALLGVCFAFVAQAILVAKHPAGHYMIPVLVASSLGLALIFQISKELLLVYDLGISRLQNFFIILLVALVANQGVALFLLDKQFSERVSGALKINEKYFNKCARIYFWPASNLQYALFFGSWNTKYSFAQQLENYFPDKAMMFLIDDGLLHGMRETQNIALLSNQFPCIFARGESVENTLPLLNKAFKSYKVKDRCRSGTETILTWGTKCEKEN